MNDDTGNINEKRNVTAQASVISPRNYSQDLHENQSNPHSNIEFNYDVAGSTYALQVALKNMKERYQRLQKKLSVIEDENTRLIGNKSELFGEIGQMQENSIKLREKNLKLNHEVHHKHQECCSVREQMSSFSQENIKLTTKLMQTTSDKRKLLKQVDNLDKENKDLRDGLSQIMSRCRSLPGLNIELSKLEEIARQSSQKSVFQVDSANKFSSKEYDADGVDGSDEESGFPLFDLSTLGVDNSNKDTDTISIEALERSKKIMKKMANMLLKQKQTLTNIHLSNNVSEPTIPPADYRDADPLHFTSRFATYNPSTESHTITLTDEQSVLTPPMNDSGGETNVLVEEKIVSGRRSPFDWRQVEVSDDDNEPPTLVRPLMKTVSTSPDLTLTPFDIPLGGRPNNLGGEDDEDRTCPMCNAIFPVLLPQETFESHVVSHFEVENGFEVIT